MMTEFEFQALKKLDRICELLERRDAGDPNLLRAIHSAVRGAMFTTAELMRHAALPENFDLQTALEREFDYQPNSHRIGKFLASIAGRQIDGFIVKAIGEERHAVIWRVRVCPSKLTSPVAHEENAAHADDSFVGEGITKCG